MTNKPPTSEEMAPLTVEDVEAHLRAAVRRGSVTAIKLWLDRHGQDSPGSDPFDELLWVSPSE
jgi:hypothetical protein